MFTSLTSRTSHFEIERKKLLDTYHKKQSFRVTIGKSTWIQYESFNPKYNMREILNDEIVIEFDCTDKNLSWIAIDLTAVNLYNAGYIFQIWDHQGKSPHIHIHNLPIKNHDLGERTLIKKMFIRKYVPREYLQWCDISLTGVHLIALEWSEHWKGCYDVKRLLHEFNPLEDSKT